MHLYRWETNIKNRALASTTIHKYQFPLLHYFGMQRINLEVWLVNFPKSFPRLVLSSQPSLMCRDDRRHLHYGCYVLPFSNSLRHFVTCRTLVTSSSYTFINRQWTSRKKTRVTHKKRITVRTSSPDQKSPVSPTHPKRWSSDCCAICCTLSLLPVLPSTNILTL